MFERNTARVNPWVRAAPSSRLWRADLPDDLGPGACTLTVRATNEFGRVHHGHRVLEIVGSGHREGRQGSSD